MLRSYDVMVGAMREMRPAVAKIEACDRDLARQLRRASSSVALNVGE